MPSLKSNNEVQSLCLFLLRHLVILVTWLVLVQQEEKRHRISIHYGMLALVATEKSAELQEIEIYTR